MSLNHTFSSESIRTIHILFNELCQAEDFISADEFLSWLDPNHPSLCFILSVLTATAPYKDKLPSRVRFYNRVTRRLDVLVRVFTGEYILSGLK